MDNEFYNCCQKADQPGKPGIPRAGGTRQQLRQAGVKCVGRTAGISRGYPQLEDGRVGVGRDASYIAGHIAVSQGHRQSNLRTIQTSQGQDNSFKA